MTSRLHLFTLLAASAFACGCSGAASSETGGDESADTSKMSFVGDYVRTASSKGTIQELLFSDDSHYEMLPVGCTDVSSCTVSGSYDYDGTTLTLTDAKSGNVTELPVSDLKARTESASTGSLTQSRARGLGIKVTTDGLVSGANGPLTSSGGALTNASGGQLVTTMTMSLVCASGQTCAASFNAGNNTMTMTGSGTMSVTMGSPSPSTRSSSPAP